MSHPLIHDLVAQLDAAPHGQAERITAAFALKVGRHVGTVNRWLRHERGPRRSAAGTPRVDDDVIFQIETVRRRSSDVGAGRLLPADLAIEKAVAAGVVAEGEISVGQFRRRVRAGRLARRRRCVRFEAKRSNQVHHVDASGSEYFVVEERGNERVVRVARPGSSRKNRPRKERELLWLYGVVDDHSRVAASRYVAAAGETAVDTIHTLAWAWSGDDPRMVLSGLPEQLYADRGPFANSGVGRQFCESLGVILVPRKPGNPRASGKIERGWRTCWRRFELAYLDQPDLVMSLDELNAEFANYLAREAGRAHPREKEKTRTQVYLADRGEVRSLPADYLKGAWRPETRKVAEDGTIQFENGVYGPFDELVGETVTVFKRADGALAVASADGRTWAAEPFEPLDFGTYKMPPPQPGDEVDAAAASADARGPALYAGDHEAATLPLVARGVEAEVESPFDDVGRFVSVDDAMRYVGRRIGVALGELGEDDLVRLRRIIEKCELRIDGIDAVVDAVRNEMAGA